MQAQETIAEVFSMKAMIVQERAPVEKKPLKLVDLPISKLIRSSFPEAGQRSALSAQARWNSRGGGASDSRGSLNLDHVRAHGDATYRLSEPDSK